MVQWVHKYTTYYIDRIKYPIMETLTYRTDILVSTISMYMYMFMQIIFLGVVVNQFSSIGEWGFKELAILFATGQLIFFIVYGVFTNLYDNFSTDIERGNLDYYLLKPISPLFNYSTRKFELIWLLPAILLPILILIVERDAIYNLSIERLVLYLFSVLLSMTTMFFIYLAIGTLSFWFTDTIFLYRILFSLWDMGNKFPIDIYPKKALPIFAFLIPVGLLAYAPAYFLVFGFSFQLYALQIVVTIFFGVLSLSLWKLGLRKYTSASS